MVDQRSVAVGAGRARPQGIFVRFEHGPDEDCRERVVSAYAPPPPDDVRRHHGVSAGGPAIVYHCHYRNGRITDSIGSCTGPLVATTWPAKRSSGLPSMSVTLPPASSTSRTPAAM